MPQDFDADDLFFGSVVARAERMSLLAILTDVADSVGYRDPGSLSVLDRFYAQRKVELERLFLSLEDGNPALAARLHARFDSARESLQDDQL